MVTGRHFPAQSGVRCPARTLLSTRVWQLHIRLAVSSTAMVLCYTITLLRTAQYAAAQGSAHGLVQAPCRACATQQHLVPVRPLFRAGTRSHQEPRTAARLVETLRAHLAPPFSSCTPLSSLFMEPGRQLRVSLSTRHILLPFLLLCWLFHCLPLLPSFSVLSPSSSSMMKPEPMADDT